MNNDVGALCAVISEDADIARKVSEMKRQLIVEANSGGKIVSFNYYQHYGITFTAKKRKALCTPAGQSRVQRA